MRISLSSYLRVTRIFNKYFKTILMYRDKNYRKSTWVMDFIESSLSGQIKVIGTSFLLKISTTLATVPVDGPTSK